LISLFEKWDIFLAEFIFKHIKNSKLDFFLSKTNRGEVFIFLILYLLYTSDSPYILSTILYISIFSFLNDQTVLWIKKKISRKRPSLKIMGKENNHPDLNHSFPSAHAANSMTACVLLYGIFYQPPLIFLFSVLAGVGRMLTLHHFLSDILGGWLVGAVYGISGIIFYYHVWLKFSFLNF
jgi:membrane-associated phospholipid phosphatase